jgi:uncharacterized protein
LEKKKKNLTMKKELEELNEKLSAFVEENTKIFDDSHNHFHMAQVVKNSFQILDHDNNAREMQLKYPEIATLVLIVAWLHDVRDHKYPNSISEEHLRTFIDEISSQTDLILDIIANISFSKEAKGLRKTFSEPYQTVLNVVTDADRLEAIGAVGIVRCETFARERGERVPEDVVIHCHEKLLRLLPEGYFKTDYGKQLALPLHQEIEEYVKKNEKKI